ncbi:MAG: hypothetical protein H0W62_08485 [Chitinophagales bacterium]|nr:hypothetical protein [Chitinophagales bacterium]
MKLVKTSSRPENHYSKSLGPVSDLESHEHPEWWRFIFNSLYLMTD